MHASRLLAARIPFVALASAGYSGTRVAVSRNRSIQVDATIRERRSCTKLNRAHQLWFRSNPGLKMKSVAQLGRDHPRIVEVKTAHGDGVILQHPMIRHVQHTG